MTIDLFLEILQDLRSLALNLVNPSNPFLYFIHLARDILLQCRITASRIVGDIEQTGLLPRLRVGGGQEAFEPIISRQKDGQSRLSALPKLYDLCV